MTSDTIVDPEGQNVTFVELFFDLVFVYAVTQVVSLLHSGLAWVALGRAVLVFWLVWWAWTQFTWALNAADTTHSLIELGTLVATAIAFLMAVAIPDAFGDRAEWFAIAYVLVRTIGLVIYAWVASANPSQRTAVGTFGLISVAGLMTALLGGALGGTAQIALWDLTILLDVIAAVIGGRMEGWDLHPDHFAERHSLFVIIALGETLIVAAGEVTGVEWSYALLAVGGLAVALTCGLWWSYFVRARPLLDDALRRSQGRELAMMSRDVGSLLHFVMLCGLVACAVTIEGAVAHPVEPLPFEVRAALAAGLVLFVGGMAAALWRAARRLPVTRLLLMILTGAVVIVAGSVPSWASLGIAFAGVALAVALEEWEPLPTGEDASADEGRSRLVGLEEYENER
jgi:low temperature requirement protein LtrA